MGESRLCIVIGPSEMLVGNAWESATAAQKRAVLWDIPHEERRAVFSGLMKTASLSFICLQDGIPVCAAWTSCEQGLSAHIHMFVCGKSDYLKRFGLAAMFLLQRRFRTVLCLVPSLFLGTGNLLKWLCFAQGPTLYRGSYVNGRERNLVLYWKDLYRNLAVLPAGIKIIYGEEEL